MKGQIYCKKLNIRGVYISDSFNSDINNTKLRLVVTPLEGEIKYLKIANGYIVSGEGCLIDDTKEQLSKYKNELCNDFKLTRVNSKDELW